MAAAESMLPPCGSQGLSGKQATQSQVLSTSTELSEHMMFFFGSFGQERRFPLGAYIPDPELLDDQRDAVITQLMMPIGRIRPWIEPAAGGAPQPADAPSDAESVSDQDTPEQGVSGGQLCAVSTEKLQGRGHGRHPNIYFRKCTFL